MRKSVKNRMKTEESELVENQKETVRKPGGRPPKPPAVEPGSLPLAPDDVTDSPGLSGMGPETYIFFPAADKRREPFVRIHRRDDARRWVLHGILSPEDASEFAVATLFGGGFYSAQLIEKGDDGMRSIKGTRHFTIPGKYIPPTGDLPGVKPNSPEVSRLMSGSPVSASSPPQAKSSSDFQAPSPREALDMAFATKLMEVLKPATEIARGTSIIEHLPAIATALAPVLVALFQSRAPVQPAAPDESTREILEAIRSLAENMKAVQQAPQTPIGGAYAAMQDMMKFKDLFEMFTTKGGKASSDDDDEEQPQNFDQKLLSMGMELARGLVTKQPQPQAAPPSSTMQTPTNPVEALVYSNAGRLIDAARRGIDPGLVAGIVQQYCPVESVGTLNELIGREDLETYLPQLVPDLRAYPKWLGRFVGELRSMYAEVEDENEEGEEDVSADDNA